MRTFVVVVVLLAALVVGAVAIGIVSFSDSGADATITIDKEEVKEEVREAVGGTEKALDRSREAVNRASEAVEQATDDSEPPVGEESPAPAAANP